jgi:transposase
MLADALGRPLRFIITPGQTGDVTQAEALIAGSRAGHVIADRAYDSRALREAIQDIGAKAVIPPNPTRKHPHSYDPVLYRLRNRIERCFNRLKHFRRIATRYDRRAEYFLACLHIAGALQWMP